MGGHPRMLHVTVRLPVNLVVWLDRIAHNEQLQRSAVIRAILMANREEEGTDLPASRWDRPVKK